MRRMTTLEYLLLGLVPYTKQNLALSFSPRRFFYDLEQVSRANKRTLQSTHSRAIKNGLIERNTTGAPTLTDLGERKIHKYRAQKLRKSVQLMVAFDIPETKRSARQQLRYFLRTHRFTYAQKSVWVTEYDHRQELATVISTLDIAEYVSVYECSSVSINC